MVPLPLPDSFAIEGVASVCQSPVGMKQNCRDPDSRIVDSMADKTSFMAATSTAAGFPDKRLGIAVNYTRHAFS